MRNGHVDHVNCSRGIHRYHVGLANERDLEGRLDSLLHPGIRTSMNGRRRHAGQRVAVASGLPVALSGITPAGMVIRLHLADALLVLMSSSLLRTWTVPPSPSLDRQSFRIA